MSNARKRPPSFRALTAFEAAARLGSFSKAAIELNLTPSAISHAVKKLEQQFGISLFIRKGRTVRLTDEGRLFATRIRIGLGFVTETFREKDEGLSGTVTVSTLHSIAIAMLFPVLRQKLNSITGIRLDIRLSESLESFDDESIDLAIRYGPGDWPRSNATLISNESLVPVVAPEIYEAYGLSNSENLAFAPLLEHPMNSWRLWFERFGKDVEPQNWTAQIDDAGALVEAARVGLGVALSRLKMSETHIADGSLIRVSASSLPAEYGYYAVWRKGQTLSAQGRQLIEWLLE